ncbi:GntR family transcriptional regulator [Donghicola sp. C2-DW-16]|uniref:GntR family transcriptional regulator n=1 Tax=Donghicola mangrovi TaxID=2729614 RepID=A0ABX2PFC9_9RHOB|nr:GntR family transcriptional regulator [Donghicola mangrovi]NVO28164.1 GntR family transcriptional regulator [Donghicola mangrovi]
MKDAMILSDDISEVICATLRAAIFEGALKPGDKLKEDILAQHFKASRTVVRGALSLLAQQNLAERRRNHGTFVASPTPLEARNLLETRRIIELSAMDALQGKLGEKEFEVLEKVVDTERRVHAGTDFTEKKKIAGEFDYTLVGFTGNEVLLNMLQNVLTRLSLVTALYARDQGTGSGVAQHEAIVDLLRKGEFDAARTSMAAHLDEMAKSIAFEGVDGEKDEFLAILERMTAQA